MPKLDESAEWVPRWGESLFDGHCQPCKTLEANQRYMRLAHSFFVLDMVKVSRPSHEPDCASTPLWHAWISVDPV